MVNKQRFLLAASVFLIIVSLNFVFSGITNSPANVTRSYDSGSYVFNITINNTNAGQLSNISQVSIILPAELTFLPGDWNGTNTGADSFTGATTLSWANVTRPLINGSAANSYFWFNASFLSTTPLANYNIIVRAVNGSGTNQLTNLTLTIADLVNPKVTIVSLPNSTNYSQTTMTFTLAVDDTPYNLSACNYTLNSGGTNYTMSLDVASAPTVTANATNSSIGEGNYVVKFYCWDASNNLNSTSKSSFKLDTTVPFVRVNYPSNNVNLSSSTVQINVTANDTGGAVAGVGILYANITVYDTSGTAINATTNVTNGNSTNYLTVPDGNYYINTSAYDLLGQINTTSIRVTVDTTAPVITIYGPINNTNYYANQSILIYFSRNDTTAGSLWFNYNGTKTTNLSAGIANVFAININYNSTGFKNITFFSNDTFGNIATVRYTLNITAAIPGDSFISNDTTYNVSSGNTSLVVPFNSTLLNVNLTNESQQFSLDLSQLMSSNVVTLGANPFTLVTLGAVYNYTVYIPASSQITGPTGWDGKINLPTLNTSSLTMPNITGYTTAQNLVIDLGSSSEINFSSPAKITLSGMAGKRAAWAVKGNTNLTDISTQCTNTTTGAGVSAGSECFGDSDSGTDLVIWTYHFSTFAAYTRTVIPTVNRNSDSGTVTDVPYWTATFTISADQFTAGNTQNLGVKGRFKFLLDSVSHSVGVVALSSTQATINVSSTPQQAVFNIGDEKKFDVNADNYYDVSVKLNSITDNKASVTIKSINEAVTVAPAPETQATTAEKVKEAVASTVKQTGNFLKSSWLWIVLVVVVAGVVLLLISFFKRKRKKRRGY